MLTASQKRGNLIPVSAKNADGDSKPLLDTTGRTASVCDAIFVRELPDFTVMGGWSRNKGFSPRISAPVTCCAGFEQPPASIVLKNDLGGFVQILTTGGLYDKFNQISEQRTGSYRHQRHPVFKGEPDWFRLEFILSAKRNSIFTNRIKCVNVFIELEKLNRTETAPESMRYIYARFLCREVANKAMPNKRARFCRVFQLPTPDGFRLPMKKETENAKYHQISKSEYRHYNYQWRKLFEREPDWFLFGIGISGKGGFKNLSETQKGICSGNVDSRRNADNNRQQINPSLFFTRSSIDRDVRANARRGAIPRLYLGRFGRQAIHQSPSGTNQTAEIANKHFANGLSLRKRSFFQDLGLQSERAFNQGNRQTDFKISKTYSRMFAGFGIYGLSCSTAQTRQTEKTAFPAVRRVKPWGKSLNYLKSGFTGRTSAKKLKTRLKTANLRCPIWNWHAKFATLSIAKFNCFLSLTLPAAFKGGRVFRV